MKGLKTAQAHEAEGGREEEPAENDPSEGRVVQRPGISTIGIVAVAISACLLIAVLIACALRSAETRDALRRRFGAIGMWVLPPRSKVVPAESGSVGVDPNLRRTSRRSTTVAPVVDVPPRQLSPESVAEASARMLARLAAENRDQAAEIRRLETRAVPGSDIELCDVDDLWDDYATRGRAAPAHQPTFMLMDEHGVAPAQPVREVVTLTKQRSSWDEPTRKSARLEREPSSPSTTGDALRRGAASAAQPADDAFAAVAMPDAYAQSLADDEVIDIARY